MVGTNNSTWYKSLGTWLRHHVFQVMIVMATMSIVSKWEFKQFIISTQLLLQCKIITKRTSEAKHKCVMFSVNCRKIELECNDNAVMMMKCCFVVTFHSPDKDVLYVSSVYSLWQGKNYTVINKLLYSTSQAQLRPYYGLPKNIQDRDLV